MTALLILIGASIVFFVYLLFFGEENMRTGGGRIKQYIPRIETPEEIEEGKRKEELHRQWVIKCEEEDAELKKFLNSKPWPRRELAIAEDAETKGLLERYLASDDPLLRTAAFQVLKGRNIHDESDIAKAISALQNDEDPRVRFFAALLIWKVAQQDMIPLLLCSYRKELENMLPFASEWAKRFGPNNHEYSYHRQSTHGSFCGINRLYSEMGIRYALADRIRTILEKLDKEEEIEQIEKEKGVENLM